MTAPISAVVTAYRRVDQTLTTLKNLQACDPAPAEIIAHVDGGNSECARAIADAFPAVRILQSAANVGPGGGRNLLVQSAAHNLVASFDDDAYPLDRDYFARAVAVSERFPDASVVVPRVFLRGEPIVPPSPTSAWVADYCGAACVFRRDAFLTAGGYVPVPIAYGMEEADLALRLHARHGRILETGWLRAIHDTALDHHGSAAINAATISNLVLLAFLRYPIWLWAVGAAQCLRRILWLVRHDRWQGITTGISAIPSTLRKYAPYRGIVKSADVLSYWRLRRHPVDAAWQS